MTIDPILPSFTIVVLASVFVFFALGKKKKGMHKDASMPLCDRVGGKIPLLEQLEYAQVIVPTWVLTVWAFALLVAYGYFFGWYPYSKFSGDTNDYSGSAGGAVFAANVTILGITSACVFAHKQLKQQSINFRIGQLRTLAAFASENVFHSDCKEGICIKDEDKDRYIVGWRVKKNQVVFALRILRKNDETNEILSNDTKWWEYRVGVPKFGDKIGIAVESCENGMRDISMMTSHDRNCIYSSMMLVQMLNCEELKDASRAAIEWKKEKNMKFDFCNMNESIRRSKPNC